MPSQVGAQVARRMAVVGLEVQKANRTATDRAAFAAKNIIAAEIQKASGGDNRLSGVGSAPGARVGVRYDVKGTRNPTALVRAIGPLHLLENPTRAHVIIPKATGRSKGRTKDARRAAKQELYSALFGGQYAGQKPMRTPYGPRYRVNHPGTSNPRRPWAKGLERARPLVKREVDRAYVNAFRRGATR